MADQTVKIANMPDAGSREAVAFELAKYVWDAEWTEARKFDRLEFLTLYHECFRVVSGNVAR